MFLCVAIVSIYGDDVIDQGLPSDEILLHFSSLAMHMNGDLVLRKVNIILYLNRRVAHFRLDSKIMFLHV